VCDCAAGPLVHNVLAAACPLIHRSGKILETEVELGLEDGMGTNRILHWCGAQLQVCVKAGVQWPGQGCWLKGQWLTTQVAGTCRIGWGSQMWGRHVAGRGVVWWLRHGHALEWLK